MEHHIKKVHNLDSDTYYISVTTKKKKKLQMHIESDQMELALHTHVKYVDKLSQQKTLRDHLNACDCNLTSFIISKLHFPVSNAKMVTSLSKTGQCHHYI